eukprot:6429245-Prymnesium_polylepis.3
MRVFACVHVDGPRAPARNRGTQTKTPPAGRARWAIGVRLGACAAWHTSAHVMAWLFESGDVISWTAEGTNCSGTAV